MNADETKMVLALAASYDGRKPSAAMHAAWYDALHDLDLGDCQLAVRAHYRDDTSWLMPAQVRLRVKSARQDHWSRDDLRRALDAPPGAGSPPSQEYVAARGGGRDPERIRALTVRCPHCPAWVGQGCMTVDGEPLWESPAHPSRILAAGGDPEWAALRPPNASRRSDPSAATGKARQGGTGDPAHVSAGEWRAHHPPETGSG